MVFQDQSLGQEKNPREVQSTKAIQERNKEETREKQDLRPFQGTFLLALTFLVILKAWLWFLKALTWDLMIVLHAITSYDKVHGWLKHDNHDYGMK